MDGMNTLIVVIVQLVTFGFAYRELNKWRAELVGTKKIELAFALGRAALETRRALKELRSHVVDNVPSAPEYPVSVTSEYDKRDYDQRHLWSQRFQKVSELLQRLDELSWDAEIVLGEDISYLNDEYGEQFRTVWLAAQRYLFSKAVSPIEQEKYEKIMTTLYGKPGDELDLEIEETARKFKAVARKYIEPPKSWDSNDDLRNAYRTDRPTHTP